VKFTNTDPTPCPLVAGPIQNECGSFTGISVTNSVGCRFAENKVKSDNAWGGSTLPTAFNNRPTRGFFFDSSPKLNLQCNTTTKLTYGIVGYGNCNTASAAIAPLIIIN
jgi:hypothetical protein